MSIAARSLALIAAGAMLVLSVSLPAGARSAAFEARAVADAQAPMADFSADRVEIKPEMEIQFNDDSTGTVTAWSWDFGDGSTSTEQNPKHLFVKNGYYTVTLKVTGSQGSDVVKKVDFIRVSEDCKC